VPAAAEPATAAAAAEALPPAAETKVTATAPPSAPEQSPAQGRQTRRERGRGRGGDGGKRARGQPSTQGAGHGVKLEGDSEMPDAAVAGECSICRRIAIPAKFGCPCAG
jgi:hypothetical protein